MSTARPILLSAAEVRGVLDDRQAQLRRHGHRPGQRWADNPYTWATTIAREESRE